MPKFAESSAINYLLLRYISGFYSTLYITFSQCALFFFELTFANV